MLAGCGEVYLPGYVNIDIPLAQHSIQRTSKADMNADICELSMHLKPFMKLDYTMSLSILISSRFYVFSRVV